MFDVYLPLLPSSYLSHSVITTIWIGIWVVAFFNLRYGWVFTGLIVPGYLTPLLLIKPLSVGVIIFESIMTYWVVYMISEFAAKRGWWTNFFGRDRFFMILLMSVVVRLFFDGWSFPWIVLSIENEYGIVIDYDDSFHSFGLIIVALIANQLWKPGILQGSFQLFVTLGITYLITRYIFVEYTNFSLSNISYMYEDIAGSILASPKSYIILIVTALIASRMNLFYGWEFNGILVPSLLALQWYQPTKILTSFVEAYIILFFAMMILRLPFLRHYSMEGARKVLLFFNVGFLYKIGLSFFIIYFFPEHKVSDFFAFGYLLSTLIAIKIYDKVNMALFTRVTLQTSLVSIVVATMIGYFLTVLPDSTYTYEKTEAVLPSSFELESEAKLIQYIVEKKINLYGKDENQKFRAPNPVEIDTFKSVLQLCKEFEQNKEQIHALLKKLHYKMKIVEGHYLVLNQSHEYYGWGMYIIDLSEKGHHLIEVPYPLETWDIVESAVVLMKMSKAKVMSISGTPLEIEGRLLSSPFNGYYSLYHAFHKYYAKNSVLQVRALTPIIRSSFLPLNKADKEKSLLFIKGYLPKELKLKILEKQLGDLEIRLEDETEMSIQKESMRNGFAELYLSEIHRRNLISSQLLFDKDSLEHEVSVNSIEGLLQSWLLDKKLEINDKNTESYVKPTVQELLFFDNVILKPLYKTLQKYKDQSLDEKTLKRELLSLVFSAKSLGYELTHYTDTSKDKDYIILHELANENKRFWGTYIFAIGSSKNIMIQVPRPFYEAQTFEYSLQLYSQLDAKVLLLSGSHPLANKDRSSDLMLFENIQNVFNLVSQVIYRESALESMNVLQVRGMQQVLNSQSSPAVLALDKSLNNMNKEQKYIYDYVKKHMPMILNEGDTYSAGYDAITIQSLYLEQSIGDTFNVLWLPYKLRNQYKQLGDNDLTLQQFQSLGIDVVKKDFKVELLKLSNTTDEKGCHQELFKHIEHYLNSRDITELQSIFEYKDVSISLLIDNNSNQPYIVVQKASKDTFIGAVKLNAQPPYTLNIKPSTQSLEEALDVFNQSTSTILKMDEKCEK
ncbi:poly-gamma-glutamate biosynthesis protein PgsC/CapC [Sulfurimonas sp. MAG313]|nr:poly-gamma-glutamate biosynthesis protein PgsC/CapC [Sulfurimonas sp. MAG313]MDF1881523.1 poly-gamma-glutamate biosynthesis protein PgsC/CapC [Sulfurimonas sp. MAG313]